MKSTVIYFSQTGNTRKVAEAIAGALPGTVTLADLASAPEPGDADVVFIGMPVVRFGPPPRWPSTCAGSAPAAPWPFS